MSKDTGLYFAQFPKNFDRLQAALLSMSLQNQNGEGHCNETLTEPFQFYREIIFTEPHLLIAPQTDEYQDKAFIIAETHILTSSQLHGMLEKFSMKIIETIPLTRNLFLYCFEFVLKHRLAPLWNKIGSYYIKGRDFLQEKGKMCAIQADFTVTDKITIALKAQMLKFPLYQIEDCGIAPNIMKQFNSSKSFSIQGHSLENNKCLVLPSLKTGYITCIGHRCREDFNFKKYWKVMYGFRIPESQPHDHDFVCRISFPASKKTFLYPGYCIRSEEPLVSLRCDQKAIFSSFIDDLSSRLTSICGSPLKFTTSSLFPTKAFSSASTSKHTNLKRSMDVSNASGVFIFYGNNLNVSKITEKTTISSHGDACSGAVCVNKPYVPSFAKRKISTIIENHISKKTSQSEDKSCKAIVPCFTRKLLSTSSSRNFARVNPGSTTKIRIALTENGSVSSEISNSNGQENVNNGELNMHLPSPLVTSFTSSQCKMTLMDNYSQERNKVEAIKSTTIKKCASPQVKRSERKEIAETHIDFRMLAKENKLPKLNVAVITKWLRSEGVHCRCKDRKGDLILKVYKHLGLKQVES